MSREKEREKKRYREGEREEERCQLTHLASFISICWRISCRSWSLRTGKMFLSSSSCLLGRFRSFTASSSFLIRRGSVPAKHTHTYKHTLISLPFKFAKLLLLKKTNILNAQYEALAPKGRLLFILHQFKCA